MVPAPRPARPPTGLGAAQAWGPQGWDGRQGEEPAPGSPSTTPPSAVYRLRAEQAGGPRAPGRAWSLSRGWAAGMEPSHLLCAQRGRAGWRGAAS